MPARKLSSSNFSNQRALAEECVVNDALTRVGARWKMQILHFIDLEIRSFGALKRSLPGVSDHILGTRLRELVGEGLADKRVVSARQFEYVVTERGAQLLTIVHALCDWERASLADAAADQGADQGADLLLSQTDRAAST